MQLETVPLFVNKKELFFIFALLFLLFCGSLSLQYIKYNNVTKQPLYTTKATLINHYQKVNKRGATYDVFKLKSDEGFTFYTISYKPKKIPLSAKVFIKFKTKQIKFTNFLSYFFAQNVLFKQIKTRENSYLNRAKLYITNQHKTFETKEIFSALFFASSISKSSRVEIQKLGISHLIAISGFHLGLLSLILFFLFTPFYKFFQNRYFPYRNIKADLSFLVFLSLFAYMYLIDFSPSFLRSFVMAVFGFFLFSRHIKIISFMTLLLSVCFILVLFPKLLFSLSFWFSISGVFYIFLFLKHFVNLNKIVILLLLNFWVYIAMLPIVHYVFPTFTTLQLFSPIFSILFTIFYPFELFLHLIRHGGLLDGGVEYLMNLKTNFYEFTTPLWFLSLYIMLSFFGIFYRWLAVFTLFVSLGIFFI